MPSCRGSTEAMEQLRKGAAGSVGCSHGTCDHRLVMSDRNEKVARLEEVNSELKASLRGAAGSCATARRGSQQIRTTRSKRARNQASADVNARATARLAFTNSAMPAARANAVEETMHAGPPWASCNGKLPLPKVKVRRPNAK